MQKKNFGPHEETILNGSKFSKNFYVENSIKKTNTRNCCYIQITSNNIANTHFHFFLLFSFIRSFGCLYLFVTWPMAAKKWIIFGRFSSVYICALSCIFSTCNVIMFHKTLYIPLFAAAYLVLFVCCILCTQVHYWFVSSSSSSSISIVCSKWFFSSFNHFRHFRHFEYIPTNTERDNSRSHLIWKCFFPLKKKLNVVQKHDRICDDRYRLLGF